MTVSLSWGAHMCDPVVTFLNRSCSAPTNKFGPEFVAEHLLIVERFAVRLAQTLGADQTVVRMAALLHDIAAIEDASQIPVHAERGELLVIDLCGESGPFADGLRLDRSQVERIAMCVREHSSPRRIDQTILESVCVSNADAMSQIARPFYWFHYARSFKGLSHAGALEWYQALVEHNWNGLIDAAREIIAAEHASVTTLLRHGAETASLR